MTTKKNIFFICISFFLFTACSLNNPSLNSLKYTFSTQTTDLSLITRNLVMDMENEIKSIIPNVSTHVYVTDFVNSENLEINSELSVILSSEVKTHISKEFHLPIKELEYSKYMKIGTNGTRVLTRNIKEINEKDIKKTFVFVGSYSSTKRQLLLHLKLINMKNGNILAMTSSHVELTDELKNLEQNNQPIIRPHLVL